MKLAILGSGMIVRDFLSIADEIPGLVLAAIFGQESTRPELERLQAEHGIGKVYVDYDACLADPEIDTVYVGLPNGLHFEFARRALEAGKHVICEKPFTLNLDELRQLRAIAEKNSLILVEAITTLYLANYAAIRERVAALGRIRLIQCEYSQFSSRYPAFQAGEVLPAFDPARGGGALMDIGIYTLHFVAGLFGRPKSITYTANVERGVDTSGIAVLAYDDFSAVCICAKDSGGPIRTKIQGEDGAIVMTGTPNSARGGFTLALRGEDPETIDAQAHPHRMIGEFRAFAAMIRDRDLAARDRSLDHSELVLELAGTALESAGIRLGPAPAGA
ncbi:Gfo/Idh/MocA family oxidoreductase [uncultured Martelella sp.]|uniref:Gfo/Idh/MocA family protein n=1 Tax=uncultured Martelella sp. TaxID=392331 RepID=UPI0029C6EBB6|nr:Gfo/Idh/MocA family oxidoreductase [uncultured Martelella sp.]